MKLQNLHVLWKIQAQERNNEENFFKIFYALIGETWF